MKWRSDPAMKNGVGGEVIDDEDNHVASINVQVIQRLSEKRLNELVALFRDSLRSRLFDIGRVTK